MNRGIQERETKDGKLHYRVQIRIKGHTKRKTFHSLTKAKLWKQKEECKIRDGLDFKTEEAKKHTLHEAISRYERDVLPNKPRAKQEQQLQWWKGAIGSYSLADLTPALIAEQRDKLSQTITKYGRKMAPTTVLRYLAALSHVFTMAMQEWGWMQESPVKKVSKPKVGLLRARFLSEEECERLLLSCKGSSNPYLYPIVVLGLATGMRKSEILGLTADSIDLKKERIVLDRTKNGERRSVPLKGRPLTVMKEFLQQKQQNSDLIFPSQDGLQSIDIRFPWEKALKAASIPDFKFHDLRHTARLLFQGLK
jgi:integrase